MNNLTGRSRHSPRHGPVSADAIASQLVRNGKYEAVDRKSSRLVSQEVSDLWRATTPDAVNISDNFSQREFAAALQHLKPGKAPGLDSICSELIILIDSVLNDALRIVTGCLRPTPTDHLPVLSGIQPAELRRLGATLSLAYRGSLGPDHILYGLVSGSSDTRQVRIRSRRPFVPAARNLLDNLARLGIRASEWTNHKCNPEYCENASRFRAFVPETGTRPVGMGLPRAAWVKLNRLRTGVGRFHLSMHKWGLAPLLNCECGASEQTADHILTACPIHRAPQGARVLTVLDNET